MKQELSAVISAIRSQPWAILPDYLAAIEAIALRAFDSDVLERLAKDGHAMQVQHSLEAVAALGTRLDGSEMSMVRNGVAVVPLVGAIYPRSNMVSASSGGTSLDTVMRDMRVAWASSDVERIVMLIDSPGGVVSGLGEAAEMLRAGPKPMTSFVTGMAASAAYWLGSQAGDMVLDRAASVGSIGVVASMSRQEAVDADGRRSYEIVSSGAPFKRPDPSTEEGRASILRDVDAIEGVFVGDVAAGRRVPEGVVREQFGKGAMVFAGEAVRVGMADRIGTLEGVLSQGSGSNRTKVVGGRSRASAEIETRRRAAQ
uniref:S49 family peptidase n=1 Tax=Roseovarius sp. BRH_c41 TaxID=1629709 RepID=UPI0005F2701D|nr:S49 family peptidase [Roseovarius sp. BRH_c41]